MKASCRFITGFPVLASVAARIADVLSQPNVSRARVSVGPTGKVMVTAASADDADTFGPDVTIAELIERFGAVPRRYREGNRVCRAPSPSYSFDVPLDALKAHARMAKGREVVHD